MRAWNDIEKARHNHLIEEYDKSKENYEQAAELHQSVEQWRYLSNNYFAWASVEEAESLSRSKQNEKAKQAFRKALEFFDKSDKIYRNSHSDLLCAPLVFFFASIFAWERESTK